MNEDIKVNWVFSPSFPLTFLNSHNFGARPLPDSLSCDPLIRPTLPSSLSREREDENVWYSLPRRRPQSALHNHFAVPLCCCCCCSTSSFAALFP